MMNFISPATFAPSMLTSTTVPENDFPAWASGTSYIVGDKVILTSTHKIYQALIANSASSPDVNLTGTSPKWLEVSATNAYKMFDPVYGTQTTTTSSMTVVLTPGVTVDSIAVLNMLGTTLTISTTVGGTTAYSKTIPLQTDTGVYDWASYFFAPIVAKTDAVQTDLLPYALQVITITLSGPGTVAIGNIAFGLKTPVGELEYGAKVGIIDYSRKDTDIYGNVVVTKRAFSKRISGQVLVEGAYVDQLMVSLAAVRSTPVVWIGVETGFASLIVWGFYKDFEIDISYPTISYCSFTIEGIV
jgi:hypothetical protein